MGSQEQTVAIAIIGVAGSGKSTFINLASGSNLPVRQSLGRCTTELESSTFSLDGRTVTLIDTPGFDESTSSVLNVLRLISDYFSPLYSQGVKLAGVIYMHCIAEDRMCGPSRHNFRTFCKFCGDTTLRDVVIVTNKCSREPHGDGDATKPESAPGGDSCFANAMDMGARMLGHDGSQASAHAILRQLIHRYPMAPPVQAGMDASHTQTDGVRATTRADAVCEPTNSLHTQTDAVRTTSCADAVHELTDSLHGQTDPLHGQADVVRTASRTDAVRERMGSLHKQTDTARTTSRAGTMRELTDQVEHHTKVFGDLCQGIDAATLAEDETTKEVLQAEARNSLESIERIRYDLERLVTTIATENSRLEDENRRYRDAFSVQRTEAELRTQLLREERRAREFAEAERGRVALRLAEERASWEREKVESVGVQPRQRYGKLAACGAVVFALVCASRFVLNGSTAILL